MLKKWLATGLWMLCFASLLSAQSPKILIINFEHQTNAPIAYPNYFADQAWSDSLLQFTANWLKEKFKTSVVDYKQRNPIAFVPVLGIPAPMRSIEQTDYDLVFRLTSKLESGLVASKLKRFEGKLTLKAEMEDRKQRRAYRQEVKLPFRVLPLKESLNDIFMEQADFQKLYEDALRAALRVKPAQANYLFKQPINETYRALQARSQAFVLKQIGRGSFQLAEQDRLLEIGLTFKEPFQEGERYGRSCTTQEPFTDSITDLGAYLEANYPEEVMVEVRNQQKNTGQLRSQITAEAYRLKGEVWKVPLAFSRHRIFDLLKFEINQRLVALGIPRQNSSGQYATYEFYLSQNLKEEHKALVVQLLLAEVLAEAVQKYYEVQQE